MTNKIKWWGHQAHFCWDCRFHMATTIGNKYMVSTVGEYRDHTGKIREIGIRRFYETMVFRLYKKPNECGCPRIDPTELETAGYKNDCQEAVNGHMKMVERWKRKK